MSWRTVVITNRAKLSYENDFLIIRQEGLTMIHLTEINTLIIDSTQVFISTFLINHLIKNKIKIIFCDERRNPSCEITPYYGCHNSSKIIAIQLQWTDISKTQIWTKIVEQKIINQAKLLLNFDVKRSDMLFEYAKNIQSADVTNREGLAAKVHFNTLFGKGFSRVIASPINAMLDYGYAIILSTFNKEIVKNGYLTQIGINHKNEFNFYNLSCDLMEPFRVLIDEFVVNNLQNDFDIDTKLKLVDILNKKVVYYGKEYFLVNAIEKYVQNVTDCLSNVEGKELVLYEFQ